MDRANGDISIHKNCGAAHLCQWRKPLVFMLTSPIHTVMKAKSANDLGGATQNAQYFRAPGSSGLLNQVR